MPKNGFFFLFIASVTTETEKGREAATQYGEPESSRTYRRKCRGLGVTFAPEAKL